RNEQNAHQHHQKPQKETAALKKLPAPLEEGMLHRQSPRYIFSKELSQHLHALRRGNISGKTLTAQRSALALAQPVVGQQFDRVRLWQVAQEGGDFFNLAV